VDVGGLSNASLFMLIFLMFFGGAPGSMAGGVKVTTLGVILVVVVSRLKGARHPSLFGRTLSRSNLERALALFFIAVTLVALATLLLQITEVGAVPHPESRGQFLDLAFECVSAFGTVGLSTGVTPQLSVAGKLIITLVMFIGRLGPLTLVLGMSRRRRAPEYRYPEEELMIG
jgi:trk system potassium uptake protein TrkH